MSQQELYELHSRVQRHAILLQEQIQKTEAGRDTLMDQDQLKFIVSLYPAGPMAVFVQALDQMIVDHV